MIRFDNVSRAFGSKTAVDRLTLEIARGELFALLGPNGAGKTTTIKMLVGLLRPDAGTIHVGGLDVLAQRREASQLLGYIPEESFLYDKLSGREFLEFAAGVRGFGDAEKARASPANRNDSTSANSSNDLIETYSHGLKQRLIFAAALLHDPAALVVDEPMVGLDPRSVRAAKDLLRSRADAGAAILMSTHTLSIAEEIADRIGIVNGGRLHFVGAVAELQRELSSPHASLEPLFLELTGGNHRGGEESARRGRR